MEWISLELVKDPFWLDYMDHEIEPTKDKKNPIVELELGISVGFGSFPARTRIRLLRSVVYKDILVISASVTPIELSRGSLS